MDAVSIAWFSSSHTNCARNVSVKLKALRYALKIWNGSKSNLQILMKHCNIIINFMDDLE
jgi:hypothetical protein